jgi:hypothetical protein
MERIAPSPRPLQALAAFALLLPLTVDAALLPGDLTGDGVVDAADKALLADVYGASVGDPTSAYEPAADLNDDGVIDYRDLGAFGGGFGQTGGEIDSAPPGLFVTLNDIPDDMNNLLVAPPEEFQVTLELDGLGGSAIDLGSLSVTSDQPMGAFGAGSQLAGQFTVTPTRAVWEVPAGSNLPRTTHYLTVAIQDAAGNPAQAVYGYAVRDFAYGPQLENLNTFYLDFTRNRSLGAEVDFIEDLREFGLSTAAAPAIETSMRDRVISEIVARVHPYYGRLPDGSPGPDPVNVVFVAAPPGGAPSVLCIGGQSTLGGSYLGASVLDVQNLNESDDNCGTTPAFGVFPQAIDNLWGANAEYQATFSPLDPGLGGTPVGAHALDPIVTNPGFDPETGTPAEVLRYDQIEDAIDGFSQTLATAIAHEAGHMLGLVAHGAAPPGLWGGTSGGKADHNVTVVGYNDPPENYIMNRGTSFSFEEVAGRNGTPLPVFRALNWAYLRDRIALNTQVTGLYPAPTLTSVSPNPAIYPSGGQTVALTIQGTNFLATPVVELIRDGDPTPDALLGVVFVSGTTVTGTINKFVHPPALYDVRLSNGDGQVVTLVDGLLVQQQ